MLTIWGSSSEANRTGRTCDGATRRDFLRVGSLAAGSLAGASLGLSDLLRARAAAATTSSSAVSAPASRQASKETSVIWLWLGGGATQIETFDPKPAAPVEYRSTVGTIDTAVPGLQIGGLFPQIAKVADRLAVVRSFAHRNSGHGGGTHFVMTGYDHPPADQNARPIRPSLGSIAARVRGPNHPRTGIPTFVRLGNIYGDGPSFLGTGCAPFDSAGQARKNMNLDIQLPRLADRRGLLESLDRLDRETDRSGLMTGLDQFEGQAFSLILSEAKQAFDVSKEDPATRERYGKGVGEQLLLARRLCEAGCGFVNLHYGGWDMHGSIAQSMRGRAPQMDQGVAALIEDLAQRGLSDRVLLVITGEFGRTPRINGSGGRDHWAPLSPLAMAGGGMRMGQIVGESSPKAETPKSRPIGPQDLMATVFHSLGLPRDLSFQDQSGRPTPMISGGTAIAELI
ncbi:MAG TPA: DUF1501 domain-containing protein [Pirellulales bacterium]|jgi:hypothetical protein